MDFLKSIEKYFNSGTTDKKNKRRVGGLLIGITALLLAIAMVALTVASAVAIVQEISEDVKYNNQKKDDDKVDVVRLVPANLQEFETARLTGASPAFTLDNNDVLPSNSNVIALNTVSNAKYTVGSSKHGLQKEAVAALVAMTEEFNKKEGKLIHIPAAYEIGADNSENYKNALAVKLCYKDSDGKSQSILGNDEYEWVVKNAHRYGFVRISAKDGEQNIYRYVGLANAEYIYKKQIKCNEEKGEFYGISDYLAEVKAGELTVRSVYTSVEEGAKKTTHWVYFVSNAPEDQQSMKLPDAKFTYEVSRVADGYIVVYHKD